MRYFKLHGERVMARDFDRQVAALQVRTAKGQLETSWIEGVGRVQRDAQGTPINMYGLN